MRLCRGMPVYKNAADDDWGWDTIPFIVDGTMLLSAYAARKAPVLNGVSDYQPVMYFDDDDN